MNCVGAKGWENGARATLAQEAVVFFPLSDK